MAHTLVRLYDSFSKAEHARSALLGAGFTRESVQLSACEDEAGPVEGNFILDQKDTGKGPPSGPFDTEKRTDAYNNAQPVWRAGYMLTVDAEDEEALSRASGIMAQFGAIDIDARIAGATRRN